MTFTTDRQVRAATTHEYRITKIGSETMAFKRIGAVRYGVLVKDEKIIKTFALKFTPDANSESGLKVTKVTFTLDSSDFKNAINPLVNIPTSNIDIQFFQDSEALANKQEEALSGGAGLGFVDSL